MTFRQARGVTMRAAAVLAATVVALMTDIGTRPAQAHHSFAMYDGTVYRVFTGVVARVVPNAAHFEMHVVPLNEERDALVRTADGNPEVWVVEMEPAARAARNGITPDNFPQGTVVSVGLHPLRSGKPGGDRRGSGLFRCPQSVVPEPGRHCDSVPGGEAFGEGELPADGPVSSD